MRTMKVTIKVLLAIVLVGMSLYIVLAGNDFTVQPDLTAEQTVDEVYEVGQEVLGLEEDMMIQEMRQEQILDEVRK